MVYHIDMVEITFSPVYTDCMKKQEYIDLIVEKVRNQCNGIMWDLPDNPINPDVIRIIQLMHDLEEAELECIISCALIDIMSKR